MDCNGFPKSENREYPAIIDERGERSNDDDIIASPTHSGRKCGNETWVLTASMSKNKHIHSDDQKQKVIYCDA